MSGNNEFFENFERKKSFEKITQHAKSKTHNLNSDMGLSEFTVVDKPVAHLLTEPVK